MLRELELDGFGNVVLHSSSNVAQLLYNKKPYGDLTEEQRQYVNENEYTKGYNASMPKRITDLMVQTGTWHYPLLRHRVHRDESHDDDLFS